MCAASSTPAWGHFAFAIKVPHGWQVRQLYKRNCINAYPLDQVYIGIFSPDGHRAFEALPEMRYNYYTTPQGRQMVQQMVQQMAQMGMHDESLKAPTLPLPYLKQVLLPLPAQKAQLHPRIVAEYQDPVKQMQPGLQQPTATWTVCCPPAASCALRFT